MICFDEFGPIEVRPQAGSSWAHQRKPVRHRATYRRLHGVRHYLAAYDVHADKLWMHQKKRKRWSETLAFFKSIRNRYDDGRKIFIVLDNFSPHKKEEVVDYCDDNNITLVFTATNASWMLAAIGLVVECGCSPYFCRARRIRFGSCRKSNILITMITSLSTE